MRLYDKKQPFAEQAVVFLSIFAADTTIMKRRNALILLVLLCCSLWGKAQDWKVLFSANGGFYDDVFDLELFSTHPQGRIFYTTNGNRPTAQSQRYTEPLTLDERLYSNSDIYTIQISPEDLIYIPDSVQHCIVIRAAVFDENDSCISEVATNSYFIHSLGCDSHELPVVSICADSLDLFDYHYGIFVPGIHFNSSNPYWTGNYYQSGLDWERPMNIEFYELNNTGINQQAGMRTHGGNGRRFQQKSIKLYARESYGQKRFDHRFFETIPQDSFKHLVLKPFASSWNNTGINDHISNRIAAHLNVESLADRPVILYLNGEYWGIYYIHERPDERFLEDHFDIDPDNVNIISGWYSFAEHGTSTHFDDLYHWMETADLTVAEQYDWLKSQMDIDNFIDYQILELFLENTDWPRNNVRCWQLGDGKWRWIFYDGDACICWVTFNAFDNSVYVGDDLWPSSSNASLFFRKLLYNNEFSEQFNARFLELLNTAFSYDTTGPIFADIKQKLEPEIPFQSDRFGIPTDISTWDTFMGHSHWFLMKRGEYLAPVLKDFVGSYLITQELTHGGVFPNPSRGTVYLRYTADSQENTVVFVYDALGRQVYSQTVSMASGLNTVTLDLPLSPGLYFLKINNHVFKILRQ